MNTLWKALITLGVLSFAVAHVLLPGFEVDLILLMLLVLAALPWFAKFIKAFEIPGVVNIDLAETKAAIFNITGQSKNSIVAPATGCVLRWTLL